MVGEPAPAQILPRASCKESSFLPVKGNMLSHPLIQMLEFEGTRFIEAGDKRIGCIGIGHEPRAIDDEESVCDREGCTLVAIDERMVLCQAFPQSGCFLNQVGVVAGLRTEKRCFQQAAIPNAG